MGAFFTLRLKGFYMQPFRSIVLATLLVAFINFSVFAQDPPFQTQEYSTAYAESSHVTHWSVYIPVAALIAAGLWLGAQDGVRSKKSVGGNGSLADSKSSSLLSSKCRSTTKNYSSGSYSH